MAAQLQMPQHPQQQPPAVQGAVPTPVAASPVLPAAAAMGQEGSQSQLGLAGSLTPSQLGNLQGLRSQDVSPGPSNPFGGAGPGRRSSAGNTSPLLQGVPHGIAGLLGPLPGGLQQQQQQEQHSLPTQPFQGNGVRSMGYGAALGRPSSALGMSSGAASGPMSQLLMGSAGQGPSGSFGPMPNGLGMPPSVAQQATAAGAMNGYQAGLNHGKSFSGPLNRQGSTGRPSDGVTDLLRRMSSMGMAADVHQPGSQLGPQAPQEYTGAGYGKPAHNPLNAKVLDRMRQHMRHNSMHLM